MHDCTIFASGANFYKILPELDDAWAQILAAVPGSRLLLYPFNQNWSETYPQRAFGQRLRGALARHGVSSDRLLVFNRPSWGHDLTRSAETGGRLPVSYYPLWRGVSLLDPLMLGLPAIAMDGNNFRIESRLGPAARLRNSTKIRGDNA